MELWLRSYNIETYEKSETKWCELKAATHKSMLFIQVCDKSLIKKEKKIFWKHISFMLLCNQSQSLLKFWPGASFLPVWSFLGLIVQLNESAVAKYRSVPRNEAWIKKNTVVKYLMTSTNSRDQGRGRTQNIEWNIAALNVNECADVTENRELIEVLNIFPKTTTAVREDHWATSILVSLTEGRCFARGPILSYTLSKCSSCHFSLPAHSSWRWWIISLDGWATTSALRFGGRCDCDPFTRISSPKGATCSTLVPHSNMLSF